MRIVAGTARGRRLVVPPGDTVRPTADRVREALFSSLASRVPGASVLDGFAGTGALGLEAASRGAAHVTCVERDRRALVALDTNVATVGSDAVEVVRADLLQRVTGALPGAPFDVVLLDPPYALAEDVIAGLLADLVGHLAPDATVVVERAAAAPAPRWPATLRADEPRRYGSTRLHRATHVGSAPASSGAGRDA